MAVISIRERPAKLRRPDLTPSDSNEDICIQKKIQLNHGIELADTEFKLVMDMIKNIFYHGLQENDLPASSGMLKGDATSSLPDNLRATIHKLSWEIICKSACGKDEQEAVTDLLEMLGSYSFEAKIVLVLAAFSMTYGHFWTNAKLIDEKKTDSLILHFKSLNNLIRKMLDVADLMVELKEVTKKNETQFDVLTKNALKSGVYWIFTSVYIFVSCNMNLVNMDTGARDRVIEVIEDFSHKLEEVQDSLSQSCKQEKEYLDFQNIFNKTDQSIQQLISKFYESTDNQRQHILRQSRVGNLDVLNGKKVAFFISHFNVTMEDYTCLIKVYNQIKEEKNFEVVWIPVMDQSIEWNDEHQKTLNAVAASMPWYSLPDLPSVKGAFVWYIQQKWQFERDPILVTLGENCQVTNVNALPFVEFCDFNAFPFSSPNEEKILWETYARPISSMLQKLHVPLQELVDGGKLVCFYGGHDFYWITDFLEQMSTISQEMVKSFGMEIVYIGTDRPEAKLERLVNSFTSTESSTQDTVTSTELKTDSWKKDKIVKFWSHLRYLYNKRMNCSSVVPLDDPILKDLVTITTYDSHEDGWAIMYGGSSENFIFSGQTLIKCLTEFKSWNSGIQGPTDFINALKNYIGGSHIEKHCTTMVVPATANNTYLMKNCLVCGPSMEKSFLFKCCNE